MRTQSLLALTQALLDADQQRHQRIEPASGVIIGPTVGNEARTSSGRTCMAQRKFDEGDSTMISRGNRK